MKLLIVGSWRHSFDRAFSKFVDNVSLLDDEALHDRQSIFLKNRYVTRLFWRQISLPIQREFIKTVAKTKPDLILILKGWFFSPSMLAYMRKAHPETILFCFNPDNPFNTWHFGSNNSWITKSIPLYDAYFIWGKFLIDQLKSSGAPRVYYLPFAYDPEIDYPVRPTPEDKAQLGSDIVFVGTWDKEREFWLSHLTDFNLGIWGGDYWITRCKNKKLRQCYKGNAEHGEFLSKVLASCKISLNILRLQNKTSHNLRTFESPACGAFVLAERSAEAQGFFAEGKEAAYFSTPAELKEKVIYYLDHQQEREKIAEAGYQRLRSSGYTYLESVQQILQVYRDNFSSTHAQRKSRVCFVVTHPIPCRVPIYRKLNMQPGVELKFYFLSDYGLKEEFHPEFSHSFKWEQLDLGTINYEVLRVGSSRSWLQSLFDVTSIKIMIRLVKNQYDVVVIPGYGHFFYWIVFWVTYLTKTATLLLGEPRFPEAERYHVKRFLKHALLKILFKRIDACGYVGSQAKKFYQFYDVDDSRLFFTPYTADNDFFITQAHKLKPRRQELKKELGIPEGVPVVLYLSKLNRDKGVFELLSAYEALQEQAILVYVGSGPLLNELQETVKRRMIKNIFIYGFQNLDQVPKFYAIADIFVLFSRQEAWGLVINEAMCFGLPVIATSTAMAVYDLLRDGENGLLVDWGDVVALRNSLSRLINDQALRQVMGERSFEIVSQWNNDLVVAGLLSAFDALRKK